jgi:menaquinone-9 beta-reductase
MHPHASTDVFVVGGGPAGLATAIAVREQGLNVRLADGSAPPIEKPCGEGMSPETLVALRDLGVKFGANDGVPFRGIAFSQPDARVSADFPQGPGLGMRRITLHARLVARAEDCGVNLLWRTPVTGVKGDEVQTADGTMRARWIIGADGPGSRVRQWIGIPTRRIEKRYAARRHFKIAPWSNYVEIHWGQRAQAYVTPVADNETSIVILAGRSEDADFDRGISEFPEIASRIASAQLASRERGAVTSQHELGAVCRGNVALVGDASGGVDAITGDGIRLAVLQARALADAIVANDLAVYERAHRKLAKAPTRAGNLLLLLDRNPRLRARVLLAMQSEPELFAAMLASHVGKGTRIKLAATSAQLGWRLLAT